ncbi:arsenite methyltransferase [Paenibacillus dendritiformis]|uniref:arsenite methyltransferase n=1 Tax=Paenibacillus dendritiformis TaxID=130049 RepID=UPI00248C93DD|nr:arsenite methyltransferase [Paenibacillus dendritiformis]WGU96293.1 arsenite methyltransferase [Paenibacillus dendritiformis]
MKSHKNDQVRQTVRAHYKEFAIKEQERTGCCAPATSSSCCGGSEAYDHVSAQLGYSNEELSSVPAGANLGLGCGNPQGIASLISGEAVLDLGSGAGFDCFLASKQVGEQGRVIGVDMTPEMVSKARMLAEQGEIRNTEFRLGEIEHLPVADKSVDVIISNCVINLSPDKQQVFHEAWRVLKDGGRLAISDIVTTATLPEEILKNIDAYSCCISGASSAEEIRRMLIASGFTDIRIEPKDESRTFIKDWVAGSNAENYIVSANIQAVKPPTHG